MDKIYITERDGKQVEVTDLEAAILQAKDAIDFHREKLINNDEIIFPDLLLDWEHILSELENLKEKGIEVEQEKSVSFLQENPIYNTLKMMGVSSFKAVIICDSLKSMKNIINKEAETYYRNNVLDTIVMGKTFRKWYKQFIDYAIKNKEQIFKTDNDSPYLFNPKNFKIDECHNGHLTALIHLVLQKYYQKEYSPHE